MIISFYNVGGTPGPGPTPTPTGDTATTALLNSIIDGSVTDLHIGTGCTSVRDYAFSGCTDLTSVTMDSVTGIGVGSFIDCSGITTVEFSENLSTIGEGAFGYSEGNSMAYNHLIFHNPVPPTVSGQVFNTEEHGIIDCPAGRHRAAGAVDVQADVLGRILRFKEKQLGDNHARRHVVDLVAKENNTFLEKTGIDVIAPLALRGLLDDIRHKCIFQSFIPPLRCPQGALRHPGQPCPV